MKMPWLRQTWLSILQSRKQERLPHAMGISGKPELGTETLVNQVAQLLLCQQAGVDLTLSRACGGCKSCMLYAAGNHPDMYRLGGDSDKTIGVDEIRGLQQALGKSANQNGNKVAVVAHAEKLTVAAANALLKTLEEPPADSYLILASGRFAQLLPTIRSRLQLLRINSPQLDELADWLQDNLSQPVQADAALQVWIDKPLAALEHYRAAPDDGQDIVAVISGEVAAASIKDEITAVRQLAEIEYFVRDLHWLVADGPHNGLVFTKLPQSTLIDRIQQLKETGELAEQCQLWRNRLQLTRRQITGQSGLNMQLLVHALITDIQNTLGVFDVR